jgi:spermidine synthase
VRATGGWRIGIVEAVALGTAELVPDPSRPAGWTLLVDGVAQSYVDLADPTHLEFDYARQIAAIADGITRPQAPAMVLHLGAGGLTLPRYLAAIRPAWRQRVVERDGPLLELVRRVLPLAQDAHLELEVTDAVSAVRDTAPTTVDLVICDVFQGGELCLSVAGGRFAAAVARILAPGGLYVMNVNDEQPLLLTRVLAATLRGVFGDVCIFAEPASSPGRRYANTVLAATVAPGDLPVDRLAAASAVRAATLSPAGSLSVPAQGSSAPTGRFLHGMDLDTFIADATALNAN